MSTLQEQLIKKLTNNNELSTIMDSTTSLYNFKSLKELELIDELKTTIICQNNKYLKYAPLYTKAKIISYGINGKYEISHIHYLKDGLNIEINRNKLPFIRLDLKLYSSYHLNQILGIFLLLFYNGYSKYELKVKLAKINFKDYEKIDNLIKIKYHSYYDLKEILLHLYSYDKHPIIILNTHNKALKYAKLVSIFAEKAFLVGDINSLEGLNKGYIGDNFYLTYDIRIALKNANINTNSPIYILTDS